MCLPQCLEPTLKAFSIHRVHALPSGKSNQYSASLLLTSGPALTTLLPQQGSLRTRRAAVEVCKREHMHAPGACAGSGSPSTPHRCSAKRA